MRIRHGGILATPSEVVHNEDTESSMGSAYMGGFRHVWATPFSARGMFSFLLRESVEVRIDLPTAESLVLWNIYIELMVGMRFLMRMDS